ncbi:MAG: hypothetical protein H6R13_3608 [Proteobacteria bacterium]|nr:hypothetical protein [Pseudomonadota bacterium]
MLAQTWYARSLIGFLVFSIHASARATADGPDFYAVNEAAAGSPLVVRAQPDAGAVAIGKLPTGARCLRSLGCQGGLSLAEFTSLSAADQQQRAAANPRWCKVNYLGLIGWVEGRFLAEAACPTPSPEEQRVETLDLGKGARVVKAVLRGRQSVEYRIAGRAGQKLDVTLSASNGMTYFNLSPPDTGVAMFVGSTSGNRFTGWLPADGIYTVQVYLMRAAARRHEKSGYSLTLGLSGQPLAPRAASSDALIPGTPYHASGSVPCANGGPSLDQRCDAFVIRRGFAGGATLDVRLPSGALVPTRRILFVKGLPVASDSTEALTYTRQGDLTTIRIGADERVEVPDALIVGG